MPYYAVVSPSRPGDSGIYESWATAATRITGVSGVLHRKFDSRDAAVAFLRPHLPTAAAGSPLAASGRAGAAGGAAEARPLSPAALPPLTLRVGAGRIKITVDGAVVERSAAVASLVAPSGAERWSAKLATKHGQPKAAALALMSDVLHRVAGARLRIVTSHQPLLDVTQGSDERLSASTRRLHNGIKELLKPVTQVEAMSLDESVTTVSDALFAGSTLDTVRYSPPFEHPTRPRKRGRA